MKTEQKDYYVSKKTIRSLAKILKIEESQVEKHKELFHRIDPYTAQSLEYLAEISSEDLKLSAALSLNYLVNYKESAFE